ncbi:PIG-L deacetylase family protein [Thermoactinomyces sp. DSM 45892]|uniref:PIG-L deacetylase family protein n=1 Tax=Thermoactinomyces sp. DSM 45892 TaxID=1882753 RepID=UPI000899CAE8|nr:PIG-L family deacetylase [Thermoactinomyces sp. DSM 45892]SDY14633.1 GlcNAc-PI de-N-acetylase [Thermoactinomyces sp. DSM 45892]
MKKNIILATCSVLFIALIAVGILKPGIIRSLFPAERSIPPTASLPKEDRFHILPLKKKPDPQKPVVFYFVPHADDEVLTFGVPMIQDLKQNKEVYVVLMSHGDITGARARINKRINPGLTPRQLGQARVNEFIEATNRMGIDNNHRLIYDLFVEGGDRKKDNEQVKAVVAAYAKEYPQAEFKSMSIFDVHPEHAIIGKAIQELKNSNRIKSSQSFASINIMRTCKKSPRCSGRQQKIGMPTVERKIQLTEPRDKHILSNAADAYRVWAPKKGWYSIGEISVPGQFRELKKDPTTIIVKE